MQPRRARQVEKRFVDGQRLDQRRELLHQRAHLAAGFGILRHVRLYHNCIGTGRESLEHRHGGLHAADARHVTGRGHDAARAASDDDRLVGQFRPVALLDGSIEGIAIDMGDCKFMQAGMADHPRRTTRRTAMLARPGVGQAVTAHRLGGVWHGNSGSSAECPDYPSSAMIRSTTSIDSPV